MNKFFNSIKNTMSNLFPTKESEKTNRNESDDYAVHKSKKFDIIIRIVSVVGAIIIWLCAVTTGSSVNERMFTYTNFELKNEGSFISAAEQSGFTVAVEKNNSVTFSLKGRTKFINGLQDNEVSVYVDLSKYIDIVNTIPNNKEQTIEADIIIEAPGYFQVSNVTSEKITIKLIPIQIIN